MSVELSIDEIGMRPTDLKRLRAYRKKGYLHLSDKQRREADDLVEIAKTAFKTKFVIQLFKDYPVKVDLAKKLGVVDSGLSMIQREPRRMSATTIGLVSLYDSRYAGAIAEYRRIEDFFFRADTAEPAPGADAIASDAATDRISQMQTLIDELANIAGIED